MLFYFGEEDGLMLLNIRKRNTPNSTPTPNAGTPLSRLPSRSADLTNLDDVLLFPLENSHAYSYAHLSPNSLALRLNVLKRLLEILNERPDWLKLVLAEKEDKGREDARVESRIASCESIRGDSARGARESLRGDTAIGARESAKPEGPRESARSEGPSEAKHADHIPEELRRKPRTLLSRDDQHLRPNASSAALSALFRPKMSRSESTPMARAADYSECSSLHSNESRVSIRIEKSPCDEDDFLADELKDVIELLEQDPGLLSSKSNIAATLHDLSLSSATHDAQRKQHLVKTKLLFALATPFVESSGTTSSFLEPAPSLPSLASNLQLSMMNRQSSAGLSALKNMNSGINGPNRPFHSFSAGKHTSPQLIITVEADFPWSFKAANDLACLMFGVLKSMIKNVTLIDLIAPQFRNFVTEKMARAGAHRNLEKNIIFAGEIIAISRYSGDFAWTSIWAQKKGNLIICMFEQITCDAFDLTLSKNRVENEEGVDAVSERRDEENEEQFTTGHIEEVAGKLITKLDAGKLTEISQFSQSLAEDLRANLQKDDAVSDILNQKRYYTMQLGGEDNIPCALTSYPLEKDPKRVEIKVKIHSMPYIAGMFVVDAASFHVMSCNKAIVKNLFGASYDDVLNATVDKIIPNFSAILKAGLDDHDAGLHMVPGLVLPEHFFRKYDAKLSNPTDFEHQFLSSRGIEGLHRDGKKLFIDVQLRVLRPDVFVLWVTYSRHNKNIHRHVSRLSSEVSEITLPRQRSSHSIVNLPSQLKLFPEDEKDILELGSSAEVSRHSSTRKPKRASTFAVPITYMADTQSRVVSFDSVSSRTEQSARPSTSESQTTVLSHYYRNYTEQEILDTENLELEEKKKNSPYWPTKIGEKKRSKKYDEFRVVKKMGEGAYGKVVLAEHKKDPNYRVIIKCIDKQRILVDTWVRDRQLGTIPSEIQVMATLNLEPHPNIMRIVDYFEDPDYYYLETPIFGNPPAIDLFDYIEIKNDMSELDCQLIFKQVTLAVYHLHKHGIVHRDIKDENIIVNEYGVVKLIDFGSAGYVKLGPFDVFVGTIDYASPEVLRGEKYEGKPQDIWALGILLYTMIYKENPFYNVDEIMEADLRVPYVVSRELNDLIESILVKDVEKRPTITDVAEHVWLEV